MRFLCVFGIASGKILEKGMSVQAKVERVTSSSLYVVKKPVRVGITASNTRYSHFIHFTYTVNGIHYPGKRFVSPNRRCPQAGETISVYYDPEKPENYACCTFGPAADPIGW